MSAHEISKALDAIIDSLWIATHEKAKARKEVRRVLAGYRVVANEKPAPANHSDDDDDYHRPGASGYSRADEEWFFGLDDKP